MTAWLLLCSEFYLLVMINAHKEVLLSFFQNNIQYKIPFFQRSYVWTEENWETLWEHLINEVEEYKNGRSSEHFIGTIITKQVPSSILGQQVLELIDGQQRLTTIAILLKAIEATCQNNLPHLKSVLESYTRFKNAKGEEFIRIIHSRNDEQYFKLVIFSLSEEPPNKEHPILQAFEFFHNRLLDFSDNDRDVIQKILLYKVPVISMLLAQDDDEQEIFDTINSLGVKLNTGELLKNYIFKDKEIQKYYTTHWENFFETDDETISFWNKNKTAGRVIRTNIEVMLYCFLIIEKSSEVRIEYLFKEYKKWLKDKTLDEKKEFLNKLKECAQIYSGFPSDSDLNEIAFSEDEKRIFHIIDYLEITTVYPLLLYIYQHTENNKEKIDILKFLESYLVRRNVCKLVSKNYNNLFIQVIRELKKRGVMSLENLKDIINGFKEDSNRLPDNTEFELAFKDLVLTNKNAREILYCIALYSLNNGYSDLKKISINSYSVEHILPKAWQQSWKDQEYSKEEIATRDKKLKTIGNLTLVTGKLNSKMKNDIWAKKREALKKYSYLKITMDYTDKLQWNENEIDMRAYDLYKIALDVWPID